MITQSNIAFVARTASKVLVLPVSAIARLRTKRYMEWNLKTDNSLEVVMENGSAEQFDGFWERDECLNLILAAGRFCGTQIVVDRAASDAPPPAPTAGAPLSRSVQPPLPPPPPPPRF